MLSRSHYRSLRSLAVLAEPVLSRSRRLQGEVPERSNGAVSKTVVPLAGDRGFESLPLRHCPILTAVGVSLSKARPGKRKISLPRSHSNVRQLTTAELRGPRDEWSGRRRANTLDEPAQPTTAVQPEAGLARHS